MVFTKKEKVSITPPNLQIVKFRIVGTAPLVQNKFSQRALEGQSSGMARQARRGEVRPGVVRQGKRDSL